MDEHLASRVSVGGFFTIEPFPCLIMDDVKKDVIAVDDTVTTLFDTTGGRQMETGPLGGIPNGPEMKAGIVEPIPEEKIQSLLSYVAQETIQGRKVSFYLVVSSRGLVSGHVTDAPQAEVDHYNRLFATALPEGAQAAEKKPDFRLETLETSLTSVGRTFQALENKLKTAVDLLEKQDLTGKQEQRIQSTWEARIRVEKLWLDKAERSTQNGRRHRQRAEGTVLSGTVCLRQKEAAAQSPSGKHAKRAAAPSEHQGKALLPFHLLESVKTVFPEAQPQRAACCAFP